ncbi:MAG: IS481 family transposase [Actinomycetota bacterium]
MAHRNARLTPFGRRLLVERVVVLGWTPAAVADAASVSRATVYKWLRRYRELGWAGLEDRSSRPRRCPTRLPQSQVDRIIRARRQRKVGPHVLAAELKLPRSTIYAVLRRAGMSRLAWMDRPTGVTIRRYQMSRPGELIHVDVKKLGRIPAGGGWRKRGRSAGVARSTRQGYDYIHSAVDDYSRLAFSQIYGDETGETCARFLISAAQAFADLGIVVERVMTDEAANYTRSKAFKTACQKRGIRRVTTGPYRPRINGKVERFNRTLAEEWAYARLYRSNSARLAAFTRWLWHYNHNRPHTALNGRSPMDNLFNKVPGNYI